MAITVDATLSTSSTNPVQNKAITLELNNKADSSSLPHGVPSGGTTGQVLVKSSNSDYAVEWQTVTVPSGTKNISISSNGTTTENVTNYATASISVSVPTGTARDSSDLTANNLTVTAPAGLYASNASKTLSDANLIASNIKKDVTIFSVTGSYEGGGVSWDDIATGSQPTGLITINANSIRGVQMTFEPLNNWKIYAPNVESNSNGSGLRGARKCTHGAFPKLTSMGSGYFCYQSYELQVIDLGLVSSIINTSFIQCSALATIILRKSDGLTTLGNVNNFNNTKFANGGAGGTIYIPKTLYDHLGDGTSLDYKAASNWSTVDGYGTITWAKIEGSIYEATDWILSV